MSNTDKRAFHLVHTESSLGWGGQELRVLSESSALRDLGIRVSIVCDRQSLMAQRGQSFGVQLHPTRLRKKRWKDLISLKQELDRLQPDVVSTHSSTDHWLTALYRLIFRRRFKIVRTRHVSAAIRPSWPTRWLYQRGCEFIMTTGESIRQAMISRGIAPAQKISVVATGIDLNFFRPGDRAAARATLGIGSAKTVFTNIATLRSWKGQHDLLEAFKTLNKEDALLHIVGDGPQANSLEKRARELGIANSVRFMGYQSDIRRFLDATDVFVFPSYANEGIPQAVLQAMAYQLPIITTTAGSIQEAVSDYPHVTTIQPRAIQELASAMEKFISHKPTNIDCDIDEIRNRISLETMAAKALETYQKALAYD